METEAWELAVKGFRAAIRELVKSACVADDAKDGRAPVALAVRQADDGTVTLTNAATGVRLELNDRTVKLFGPAGNERVRIGELP